MLISETRTILIVLTVLMITSFMDVGGWVGGDWGGLGGGISLIYIRYGHRSQPLVAPNC